MRFGARLAVIKIWFSLSAMVMAYLDVVVLAMISLLIPLAMLLFLKLLGKGGGGSRVEGRNYESGEESIGGQVGALPEYLHYMFLFLAFSVICATAIMWSEVSRSVSFIASISVLMMPVCGFIFAILVLAIERGAK